MTVPSAHNRLLAGGRIASDAAARSILLILAIVIFIGSWGALASRGIGIAIAAISLCFLLVGGAAVLPWIGARLGGPNARRNKAAAVALVLLLYLISRVGYLLLFDVEFYSDFERYWGWGRGESRPLSDTVHVRAFAMFFPWRHVFSPDWHYFKFINVVYGLASTLLIFLIGRALFGFGVGLAASAIYLVWPEGLLWVQIPTHDSPGLLAFLLAIWLVVILATRRPASFLGWVGWAAGGMATGAVLTWFELIRPTSVFLLIAGIVAAIVAVFAAARADERSLAVRGLLLVAIIAGGMQISGRIIHYSVLPTLVKYDAETVAARRIVRRNAWYGGYAPTEARGRVRPDVALFRPFARDEKGRSRAIRLIMTATADDPISRFAHWARKANRLTSPGGAAHFYLRGLRPHGGKPQEVREANRKLRTYNTVFATAIYLFIGAGLVAAVLTLNISFITLFPLLALAGIGGGLILIGEVQPRFFFALAPVGSLFAVAGFAQLGRPGRSCPPLETFSLAASRATRAVLATISIAVIAIIALYGLRVAYDYEHGRFVNLRHAVTSGTPAVTRHSYLVELDLLPLRRQGSLALELPTAFAGEEVEAAFHIERDAPPCIAHVEGHSDDVSLFTITIQPSNGATAIGWRQPVDRSDVQLEVSITCNDEQNFRASITLSLGFIGIQKP